MKHFDVRITLSLVLIAISGCSWCQNQAGRAAADASCVEKSVEPFHLGHHGFKVTTPSAIAQRAFDRGLTLAYAFSHQAAEEEFRKAAAADPHLAMAWWGIALVNGPHINFPMVPPEPARIAWEALTKAEALAPQASQIERDLISALAKRYANPQPEDRGPLDQGYAAAMRELWKRHSKQADIGVLFAEAMMDLRPWDLWTEDGKPQPGTQEIVATLEHALALNPNHPGANHLYIHAVEASENPEKAVAAADRLRDLVPGASHLVHMPSHIYARVGRWEDAATANVRAMRADVAYRAAHPRPGFYATYMAHNAHFLAYTAMVRGRSDEAIRHARQVVAQVPEEFLKEYPALVDGYMIFPSEALMRFGRWDEILLEPAPKPGLPLSRALWHFTRAVALNAMNRVGEAREERVALGAASAKLPPDYVFGNNTASNLLAIAAHQLDGEIAARANRFEEAIAQLAKAARIEDTLRYDEPPDWIQPVRHTLGAVLLRAGRPAEAEMIYREDLAKYPDNGWALFGLSRALRDQAKVSEAKTLERRFALAWSKADVKLETTCFCQK